MIRQTSKPDRPFLDWEVVTDPALWQADFAVVGLPHSEPYPRDSHPNDQTLAPAAIRAQSGQFCDGPEHWDFDIGGPLVSVVPGRCIDLGDMPWDGCPYDDHAAWVTGALAGALRAGTRLIVLGGDHGVTIPVLDALEAVGELVHIVHIDAHLDWREEVQGVRRGYSSPLRWASRLAWIGGMTQIGLRGTGSARADDVAAARAYGAHLFSAPQVHAQGLEPVIATIPEGAAVYVTIDADGLDPAPMPGVLAPSPGGLRFDQVAQLLHRLARRNRVVGMDIVEIAPSFDFANHLTCITAGRLAINLIGAIANAEGS